MNFQITQQEPQQVIMDAILSQAFNGLQQYTNWPIDFINELLQNYVPYDNMDSLLGDALYDFLETGKKPKDLCLEFYINTDDMLLEDAYPIEYFQDQNDPDAMPTDEQVLVYTKEEKSDLEDLETFEFIDPLLNIPFIFYID